MLLPPGWWGLGFMARVSWRCQPEEEEEEEEEEKKRMDLSFWKLLPFLWGKGGGERGNSGEILHELNDP